jgi:hypothetical protein
VSYYPKEAARFAQDTAEHAMTILHSDGLYRHLQFKKPGTRSYWFDLITWPGYLTITGDMGTYTFERVEDMFTFFRDSGTDINPQYWSEKIRAGTGTNGTIAKEYSEDLFKEHVTEHITQYAEYSDLDEADRAALIEEVRIQILEGGDTYHEQGARASLEDFNSEFDNQRQSLRIFEDIWEWDLTDYTVHFLWCCFAIRWGISQFDAASKERKTA